MESIYSRKRIKILNIKGKVANNKNVKKIFRVFIIIVITSYTFYNLFKSLNPIFEELCLEKARQIGTYIMNNASNVVLDKIEYKNIVNIEENGISRVLKTDVVTINKIASDIALEAEKQFEELQTEEIQIPIGAVTGNKYLTGVRTGY